MSKQTLFFPQCESSTVLKLCKLFIHLQPDIIFLLQLALYFYTYIISLCTEMFNSVLQVDGLRKVYEIFTSLSVDPGVKKSAIDQLAIILQGTVDTHFGQNQSQKKLHVQNELRFVLISFTCKINKALNCLLQKNSQLEFRYVALQPQALQFKWLQLRFVLQ